MVTHWLGHLVISALVHAVMYGAAFAVFRHMSGMDAVFIAVLVIGLLFVVMPILWFLRRLFFGSGWRRW